jgi:hypothetical protein
VAAIPSGLILTPLRRRKRRRRRNKSKLDSGEN